MSKINLKLLRPSLSRIFLMYQCSIESNAFSASSDTTIISSPHSTAFSIEYCKTCRLSLICLFLIYAVWLGLIVSLRVCVSLEANVFVIILKSQFDRVIGLQFFRRLRSFPSFGSSFRYDSSWEWDRLPVFNE